jgi:hypothetical protein
MQLQQARLQTLKFLDDETGERWPLATGNFELTNEVDLALQMAANECVSVYCSMGGDFFDVVMSVATTDGTYSFNDLAAAPKVPMMIRSLALKEGSNYYSLYAIREQDVETDTPVSLSLKVRVVFNPDFTGIATGDQLRYSQAVGGVQIEWPLFDQWVCAIAAKHLAPKENEPNNQLDARIAMLRGACVDAPERPLSVIFPRNDGRTRSPNATYYRWSYTPRDIAASKISCIRLHRISMV